MANVIFCDSFSHYDTGGLGLKYHVVLSGTILPGGGRSPGSSCLRGSVVKFITAEPVLTAELAVRFAALPPGVTNEVIGLENDTGAKIFAGVTSGGAVQIKWPGNQFTSPALGLTAAPSWYHLGLQGKIHPTSGYWFVRLRGVAGEIWSGTQTNLNTSGGGGTSFVTAFRLMQPDSTVTDFSDLVISRDQFAGDCTVKVLYPDVQGPHNDWTPNAGTALSCVDDAVLDGDTTFVYAADAGMVTSYGFQPLGITGAIRAVQHVSALRTDAGDPRTVRQYLIDGVTINAGPSLSPGGTYQMFPRTMQVNPFTGLRWTLAEVNALIAGVVLEA